MSNVELHHPKFSNIYETDKDNNEDEDIDFQGLGLRKYLESKNIISVVKPASNPSKMGKKSKLDYAKEIAYFNQELNKLDCKDVIKESNQRLAKKTIKNQAREEAHRQLKEEGEEVDEEDIYVDKSENSFERKKNRIHDLMGNNSENILLPPLLRNQHDGKYKGKDVVFIDKNLPKKMQTKEVYFAPNSRTLKRRDSNEKTASGYSTKHTSGDKGNNTDESDVYQLKNMNTRNKDLVKRTDESLTQESEETKQK